MSGALKTDFPKAANGRGGKRKKLAPFSLRLTNEQRIKLDKAAAGKPLGSFIKGKLFDDDLVPRRRKSPMPVKDHTALAQVLGMLGQMKIAHSLDQLAMAASKGTLPLTPEVEDELMTACTAILAIQAELMRALGYRP